MAFPSRHEQAWSKRQASLKKCSAPGTALAYHSHPCVSVVRLAEGQHRANHIRAGFSAIRLGVKRATNSLQETVTTYPESSTTAALSAAAHALLVDATALWRDTACSRAPQGKMAEAAAAGGHLAREMEEGKGKKNCGCWAGACLLHLLLPPFPGSWGSDQLYFQDLDKSFSHRSWIFQLQESLISFSVGQEQESSRSAVPAKLSVAWLERTAWSRPILSSRGHKDADTHKRAHQGYSHIDSRSWPSVDVSYAPDWCKASSLSPLEPLRCSGWDFTESLRN